MFAHFSPTLSRKWLLFALGAFLTVASPRLGSLAEAAQASDAGMPQTSTSKLSDHERAAINAVVRDSTEQIWFQENVGQFPVGVRYGFKTTFGSMLVYKNHLQIVANQMDAATGSVGLQAVDITFPGGTEAWEITTGGISKVAGNYQRGETTLTPRIFTELTLRDVYHGVDLRLYSAEKGVLEFDWIVAKAQDYTQIRMLSTGQDGLIFHANGSATLDLRYQDLTLNMPETYQVIDGKKHMLGAAMVAAENPGMMRYALTGDIVADQPLVIDPNVEWSTYIDLNDLVTDATDSTPNLPFDTYIFAVNANTNGVYASGYIQEIITNGSYGNYMEVPAGFSQGTALNQNYVYRLSNDGLNITAWTNTGITGPVGFGVINQKYGPVAADLELFPDGRVILGFGDGLVQIYSADLSIQFYSGSPVTLDTINSIAIVDDNSFYVGGRVTAAIPAVEIPAVNIGPDSTFSGPLEGVIIRFSNALIAPTADWATYVGGDAEEYFTGIAMTPDLSKLVFATSTAGGNAASFGALVNPVDATLSGTEVVVGVFADAAIKPAAFDVLSFLGGAGDEGTIATNTTAAIVTATNTHFFVGGTTNSVDLPNTVGGAQPVNGGGLFDAFVSRIPIDGSAGIGFQSTYMGGPDQDRVGGISYDSRADRLLVFGTTTGNFPTLDTVPPANYFDNTYGGDTSDIFIATVDGALVVSVYATYIGGSAKDYLGQTGDLVGQGQVFYGEFSGLSYVATTLHSSDLPADAIGNPPGKDTDKSNTGNDTHFIIAFNINSYDFGDAPASYEGGTPGKDAVSPTLRIGASADGEVGPASGVTATGDDLLTSDDENGIATLPALLTTQTSHSVDVSVFNNTGAAQTLLGWIDFNRDGTFEVGESANVNVPTNPAQQTVTLTWPVLPPLVIGQSYLRVRLSDALLVDNAGTPNIDERSIDTGGFGEIEDYALSIAPLTLSVSNVSTTEGVDPFAIFTVSLSDPSPTAVTVSLVLADGTAVAADYGPGLEVFTGGIWVPSAMATFVPGATSVLVRTPIVNDTLDENTEDFTLTATSTPGSTTNPNASGTATIADNDAAPSYTINDVTRNEGAGTATFTVTLSTASGLATSVDFTTVDGTALAGADYTTTAGTLNFAAGVTTQFINVPILNDVTFENSETYTVVLSNPINATILDDTGIGTILDNGGGGGGVDDDRPLVSIDDVMVNEEAGSATFTVTLSNPSLFQTMVDFTTVGGTATSGVDFTPTAGTLTFAPGVLSQPISVPIIDDAIFEGNETFTVMLSNPTNSSILDGSGLGTIVDNPVIDNRPPVANPDVAITPEDTAVNIPVLLNDTDPDNDPLVVTIATVLPTQGTVTINPDNTLNFIPALNFTGIATINYTISDGNGGTSSTTVTVTVTPLNDPPLAVDDSATTPVDHPIVIVVLANDSDPDGNPLTVTTATVTDGQGTVVINPDGTIEFTPTTGFSGSVTIIYTISDGQGGTAMATVTVLVDAPPIATDDFASTTPDTAVLISVLLNDIDPEGLPLTIIDATILASEGTLTIAGNQLQYTPPAGVVGTVTGTYTIQDEAGNIATANVTITIAVAPQPELPIAVSDSATTVLQTPVIIDVLANDSDPAGGALTVITATVPATEGTVVINPDNTLTFTAAPGFLGSATITYTIQNPVGDTASAPVVVQVTSGNAPPVARPDFATAQTAVPKVVSVLGNDSDPDGDPLTVTMATVLPAQGVVVINGDGTLTFTSAPAFTGIALVNYSITDGNGGNSSTTVTITVTAAAPVNSPPIANDDTASTEVDQPVDVIVLVNDSDIDGDVLTVTGVTVPPAQGSASVNPDGTINYIPAPGFNDVAILTYTISDGQGGTDTALITINVNDDPIALDDEANTLPLVPVIVPVLNNDSDPNGNPLTITDATSDPAEGSIVINPDGTITFTPVVGFTGIAEVPYTITDGQGGFAQAIAFITVNSPPQAVNDIAFTTPGQVVIIAVLVNDTDPDNDPLTVIGATVDPAQGTVVINPNGTLTFTPAITFTDPAIITYTITDPNGGQSSATATVTTANAAPVSNDRTIYTYCATRLLLNAQRTASDPNGDPLTVTAVTQPRFGRVTIQPNGMVLYRPRVNFTSNTTDTFTVTLSDGNGGTTTETITVRSFSAIAGRFQGLLEETFVPPLPAEPVVRGRLTVSLNNRASFSARLEVDGTVARFSGTLTGALTYTRTLRIGGQLDTFTLTYDDIADTWNASLTGAGISLQQDPAGLERRPRMNRIPSSFNVLLVPRTNLFVPGMAVIRISRIGTISIVGQLPLGAAVSSSASLSATGSAAIYDWVPAGPQSVGGTLQLPALPLTIPTGDFQWKGNVPGLPDILDVVPAP